MAGRGVHWNRALSARFQPALDPAWRELGTDEAERLAEEGREWPWGA